MTKIGVFDSGIGGKLIANQIPQAVFIADSKYFPYGNKPQTFILKRSESLTEKLAKKGCKLIIVACNSATTNSINKLRDKFPRLTFVGIEPPIKPIVKLTKTGKAAIIGTKATLNSARYRQLVDGCNQQVKVFPVVCSGLAETIEAARAGSGRMDSPGVERLLKKYLDPVISKGVDTVGIACSHYPYLLKEMRSLYPQVTFYDPAVAVIKRVKNLLPL